MMHVECKSIFTEFGDIHFRINMAFVRDIRPDVAQECLVLKSQLS